MTSCTPSCSRADHAHLSPLGSLGPVAALVRRARADLDVLALSGTAPMMRSIVDASLRRSLAALDADLLGPIEQSAR